MADALWVAIMNGRKDHLVLAEHRDDSRVLLLFSDGLSGIWTFGELGLDMSNVECTSIRASVSGLFMTMKSKWGDDVDVDASSLRAEIDQTYAQEIEKKILIIRGPIDEVVVTAKKL